VSVFSNGFGAEWSTELLLDGGTLPAALSASLRACFSARRLSLSASGVDSVMDLVSYAIADK
jgi:hypothetical protein